MPLNNTRLSRRAVLRGAGTIAIALPWLEIMGSSRAGAQSVGAHARRFVAVYQPGGTVREKYTPTGSETAPVLSPILQPLQPILDLKRLLIVDGLEMKSAIGEQHQAGIIAWLTGATQNHGVGSYARGPSIDQVIATRLNAAQPRSRRSVELAVRWATGKAKGLLSPINSANFEDNQSFAPIPPRLDPVQIWSDLFGSLVPGDAGGKNVLLERKRSILDFVDRRYAALSQRVSAADRGKLDEHLTKIREIEQGLSALIASNAAACRAPTKVDTTGYDPRTGLNADDVGANRDISTDTLIPTVGKYMIDMLVIALACDITAVGTFQWSDTEAKHTFPWLGLTEHHHYYQHDGGFRPAECEKIGNWYAQMHAYLLEAMNKVDMGGHTLLDESVVLFGSELQEPPTHSKKNMPFLLAGGGGGLRGGRWIKYSDLPHNNMLVSILNLFGDERSVFGDPAYCTGPLANLT